MIEERSQVGRAAAPTEQRDRTQVGQFKHAGPPCHASPPGNHAGFSLTELMITLAIATFIYGGIAATFTRMRLANGDQNRAAALGLSVRGVNNQLKYDFANAGRGLWELNAYNIRYNFSDSFVLDPDQPRYFYGIADHDVEDVSGQSTLILQWWDFDIIGGDSSKTPTFMFDLGPGGSFPDSGLFTSANFIGPTAYLQTVQPGDIFLVYSNAARSSSTGYQEASDGDGTMAVWNHEQVGNATNPTNTAVILEVTAVGGIAPSAEIGYAGMQQLTVDFTETADSYFSPDMEGDSFTSPYTRPSDLTEMDAVNSAFFARKLGNRDSFHRVRYIVDTTGTHPTLLRIHNNDDPEVMLTKVNEFSVFLGLDVPPDISPDLIQVSHMDGTLDGTNNAFWAYTFEDYGVTFEQYSTLVGRHAMAANVLITAESLQETSDGRLPTASFNTRFRLSQTKPLSFTSRDQAGPSATP